MRMPEIISAYFGSRYDNQEVLQALEKEKSTYKILSDEDLFDTVVDKLLSGGVIGWFPG